jgi:MraZ protein
VFLGEYQHTIDDKGRLTIPARFRPGLKDGLVITRGLDDCLSIYALSEWEELAERVSGLPMGKPEARSLKRLFFANAADMELDKQGRIVIPPYLRESIGLEDEAVITGLYTYIEVWRPDRWEAEGKKTDLADNEALPMLGI